MCELAFIKCVNCACVRGACAVRACVCVHVCVCPFTFLWWEWRYSLRLWTQHISF